MEVTLEVLFKVFFIAIVVDFVQEFECVKNGRLKVGHVAMVCLDQ